MGPSRWAPQGLSPAACAAAVPDRALLGVLLIAGDGDQARSTETARSPEWFAGVALAAVALGAAFTFSSDYMLAQRDRTASSSGTAPRASCASSSPGFSPARPSGG
jgi:hypothetical protein